NILELNTAAKPTYLKHLLEKGAEKLVYLDPDTLLFNDLSRIIDLLNTNQFVLTPHTTRPYPVESEKREVDILRAGVFNLGFIAVKNGAEAYRMLNWWADRLYTGCIADMSRGYHVDQKWIDLVPALFEGVYILKAPGYNCATWNFHDHQFSFENGKYLVGGEPLRFFHFSAFDPFNLNVVSRNQNTYTMENIGPLKTLFTDYCDLLMKHGYSETVRWPYAFGAFDNGERIPERLRRDYLELMKRGALFDNPFETKAKSSVYQWWKSNGGLMRQEELIELFERDEQDWAVSEIEQTIEGLDLYTWFRRSNPKPIWTGKPVLFMKQLIKYWGLQILMQWLPPLLAKQYILNRYFLIEIKRLRTLIRQSWSESNP
ncbi:MAG: hypothetical protein EBZ49_09020, partial [Proteobacteria bacterium]|nr:hypothetical protein [Pseudomonadota bacterium]